MVELLSMTIRRRWAPLVLSLAIIGWGAGCGGGINTSTPASQSTTTVIVETVKKGTSDLLPVAATITVGGVTGQTDLKQGWAIITGVPLGDTTSPQQPLTVSAPGWVTVSQMLALSSYSYTSVSVEMEEADPATTGTAEGTITERGGGPLTSALVTFTPVSGDPVAGYTDKAGHYKFGGITAGQVTVVAQAGGHLEASVQVTLKADAAGTNAPINLALLSGSTKVTVTGKALRLGLETPVAGAQVQIGDLAAVTTGAAGDFTVPNVLVGNQTVKVTASGYDDHQEQISVAPGMAPLIIYLAPSAPEPPLNPYTISGKVTLLGKSDSSGATVTALNKNLGQVMDTATTVASGNYYLFVPPGPYRITVQYGAHSIGRDVVLLGGGRVLTGIDFTLSVAGVATAAVSPAAVGATWAPRRPGKR
jgi:hypothetical protein